MTEPQIIKDMRADAGAALWGMNRSNAESIVAYIDQLEAKAANDVEVIRADQVTTDHESTKYTTWERVFSVRRLPNGWVEITFDDGENRVVQPDTLAPVRPKQKTEQELQREREIEMVRAELAKYVLADVDVSALVENVIEAIDKIRGESK